MAPSQKQASGKRRNSAVRNLDDDVLLAEIMQAEEVKFAEETRMRKTILILESMRKDGDFYNSTTIAELFGILDAKKLFYRENQYIAGQAFCLNKENQGEESCELGIEFSSLAAVESAKAIRIGCYIREALILLEVFKMEKKISDNSDYRSLLEVIRMTLETAEQYLLDDEEMRRSLSAMTPVRFR